VEVVTLGEDGVTIDDIALHDETNRTLAFLLAQLLPPTFPMVCGVLYCDPAISYDQAVGRQREEAVQKRGEGDIDALLRSGHTWTVR
jgi:2-oxoglutarate ferredoxin oxidoreductase subunit beta